MTPSDFKIDKSIEPWQMQPGEPAESFSRFVLFRDLGPTRTLKQAAEKRLLAVDAEYATAAPEDKAAKMFKELNRIQSHSGAYAWQARARAYDAAMDREMVVARLAGQREAAYAAGQRHGHIIMGTLGIANKFLQKIHDPNNPAYGNKRVEELTIHEYLAIIKTAIPLERVTLGMDTMNEATALGDQMDGRTNRIPAEEAKRIAREAAAEVRANEPDPDAIVLEPPKE